MIRYIIVHSVIIQCKLDYPNCYGTGKNVWIIESSNKWVSTTYMFTYIRVNLIDVYLCLYFIGTTPNVW